MEITILWRLLPAVAAAVGVAWAGRRAARRRGAIDAPGRDLVWAVDEVAAVLVVGGVTGRLAWLALEGPGAWRSALSTVLLIRSGVETWAGIAAAAWLVARRARRPGGAWLAGVAVAAGLGGIAVWYGLCGIEGVCAGRPAAWGVRLPGYLSPVVPVGYVESLVAATLAAFAWRWRDRPSAALATLAAYALARGGLGWWRAPLTSLPTRDQVWSLVAAAVLAALAWRWRRLATGEVAG